MAAERLYKLQILEHNEDEQLISDDEWHALKEDTKQKFAGVMDESSHICIIFNPVTKDIALLAGDDAKVKDMKSAIVEIIKLVYHDLSKNPRLTNTAQWLRNTLTADLNSEEFWIKDINK